MLLGLRRKAAYIKELLLIRFVARLRIMSSEDTLRYIQQTKCSIARYGDGEFGIMFQEGGPGFQEQSSELATRLWEVVKTENKHLLICVPQSMNSLRGRTKKSKNYWIQWGVHDGRQRRIVKCLWGFAGRNYVYGDSQITRPYVAMKTNNHAKRIFPMIKGLWKDRNVVIIEGEATRMGVGNDLFSEAHSVKRILAPAENAFAKYDTILETIIANVAKDELLLLALGPTATVMASDLSKKGFQALDIGHIDIEYEWFRQGAVNVSAVSGKYTNEAQDGGQVKECLDEEYIHQIVARVTSI